MHIIVTNNENQVQDLVNKGFCPVECSIGGRSFVDELTMDHHGEFSNLEAVSLRAYRDHFGSRKSDPRFVIVGNPDADATFAVAALAGLLPHPSFDCSGLPPHLHKVWQRDLSGLAKTIGVIDIDPIGRNIPAMEGGDILMTWNAMSSGMDDTAAYQGVGLWRTLTTGNPSQLQPFLDAARVTEENRRSASYDDLYERGIGLEGGVLFLNGSRTFGFPEWYGRIEEMPSTERAGWEHPVVFALTERGNVTVGCPNKEVAEEIFGPGGLKNLFATEPFAGWGGRESVGGSPRGEVMDQKKAQTLVAYAVRLIGREFMHACNGHVGMMADGSGCTHPLGCKNCNA